MFCLSSHPSTDAWVASKIQLLWIMLLWMLVHSHLFETVLSILVARYLEVELLDHMVILLNFWETAVLFYTAAAAAAKSLQLCPTLCDLIDSNPPGSPVPGILQARTLEWVAISFSSAWKWKGKVKPLSLVWLLGTPWIAAYQAPPSMGFSRQKYWSGVPLPSLPLSQKRTKISY